MSQDVSLQIEALETQADAASGEVRGQRLGEAALLADQGAGDAVTRVHGDLIQQYDVRGGHLGQHVQRREEGVARRLAVLFGALLELGLTQPAQLLAVEHVGGEVVLAAGQPSGRRRLRLQRWSSPAC